MVIYVHIIFLTVMLVEKKKLINVLTYMLLDLLFVLLFKYFGRFYPIFRFVLLTTMLLIYFWVFHVPVIKINSEKNVMIVYCSLETKKEYTNETKRALLTFSFPSFLFCMDSSYLSQKLCWQNPFYGVDG